MIDLFLEFVDRYFFIQHCFSIDFYLSVCRTCVAFDRIGRWKTGHRKLPDVFKSFAGIT